MKYLKFFVATILFGMLLLLTYWAHVSFFKVNVVFYAAMLDGVLATGLMLLVVLLVLCLAFVLLTVFVSRGSTVS